MGRDRGRGRERVSTGKGREREGGVEGKAREGRELKGRGKWEGKRERGTGREM